MTSFIFVNDINTQLAGAISSSDTSITLASSLNLPTTIPTGFSLVITLRDAATRQNTEIVYATAITGTTLTVVRGQEGTTAQSWAVGDYAYSGITAGQMGNAQQIGSTGSQRFTTNGSWICPAGVTTAYLSGCAGGAGGGASALVGSPVGTGGGGGGGGAGQAVIREPVTVVPGTSYAVVIGAAGAGGTPATGQGNPGGNGGNTTFGGTLLVLTGGTGGGGGLTSSTVPAGGAGGSGFPPGSYGTDGTPGIVSGQGGGGAGGSGPFGGAGGSTRGGQNAGIPGYGASGYGAGGGGGSAAYNATSQGGKAGGPGTPGLLIVEW